MMLVLTSCVAAKATLPDDIFLPLPDSLILEGDSIDCANGNNPACQRDFTVTSAEGSQADASSDTIRYLTEEKGWPDFVKHESSDQDFSSCKTDTNCVHISKFKWNYGPDIEDRATQGVYRGITLSELPRLKESAITVRFEESS